MSGVVLLEWEQYRVGDLPAGRSGGVEVRLAIIAPSCRIASPQ